MRCTPKLPWVFPLIYSSFLECMCLALDMEALIELKQGFGDPKALESWNISAEGAPCFGWKGIACARGSVVNVALPGVFSGGEISPSIGNVTLLETLDLSHNELGGNIPAQINNLRNLKNLDLSNNRLSGRIPSDWSGLTMLKNLILTSNRLDGPIPHSMAQAASLEVLRLENNSLTGDIPPFLFLGLKQLRYLAIAFNDIGGPIPATIGACTMLRSIYAAHNHLDGFIPDSIENLLRLEHFEVEGNMLLGPIPEGVANLNRSSSALNLSDNYTGSTSSSFSSVKASVLASNDGHCGSFASQACPPGMTVPSFPLPGNTAFPQPGSTAFPQPGTQSRRQGPRDSSLATGTIIAAVLGGVVGGLALFVIACVLWQQGLKKTKHQSQVQNWFSPNVQANRKQGNFVMFNRNFKYTYEDIVSYAGFYDTAHVLGKGRFATVFKSSLPDGSIELAVKVFKHADMPRDFEKEIEMLASIKHPNLLMIRGFYSNSVEKVILSDYLPMGTLYDLLHGAARAIGEHGGASLPDWTARQHIALGVAQALAYLHRGCGLKILHKDVKSTNILLETDMTPHLADYALVQLACGRLHDGVETPGYTAPEVLTSKKYTEKSDVYSFGVVLLELITGNEAVSYVGERLVTLTNWVTRLHKDRRGMEVYDVVAFKTCPMPQYIAKALTLAVQCVDENPNIRPSMSEIASVLEGLNSSPSPLRSPEFRANRPLLT